MSDHNNFTIETMVRVAHALECEFRCHQRPTRLKPALSPCSLGRGKVLSVMKLLERITLEPGKCGGQPCIRGKRMRVTDLLDLLSQGASHEEILADYAFLEPDDILAAIAYASRLTDHVVLTSV